MSRALRPLFVTVTWGAGGSTSSKSLELAEICQRQLGLTTCLHLTCTNMRRKLIDEALEEAKALGIRNILALRGDLPRSEEYRLNDGTIEEGGKGEDGDSNEDFTWAIDLVRYIRRMYGDYFCVGVAAYPEGHADESYPEVQDPLHDLQHLVEKVQAGADFIMTQLFFDVNAYTSFEKLLREHDSGAFKDIPIIPGLMPIQSYQILKRTTKLSHARLPPDILERLEGLKGDDEAVKRLGVDIISEIVEDIKGVKTSRPRGFHFYTLNLEKALAFILERTKLIPPTTPGSNDDSAIDDSFPFTNGTRAHTNGVTHPDEAGKSQPRKEGDRRRLSSTTSAHNRIIVDPPPSSHTSTISSSEAGLPTSPTLASRATTLAISSGEGSLGREATWDDFPNGRFGDARSPAYGEIDGYGTSLHVSIAYARQLWGCPSTRQEIGKLFVRHVQGDLESLPWSEGGVNAETGVIRKELVALIDQRGWWTVASQPSVDGVSSSDPIFGWGPAGGFIFQKSFVELFIPSNDWKTRLRPYLESADVKDEVSWYAGNAAGEFESSEGTDAVNAVTWGAFPGKEILTPTIIEEVSFRAWMEEAFGIWAEWERVYHIRGEGNDGTRKLLRECREGTWLVNVICHGYREPARLWEILMGA